MAPAPARNGGAGLFTALVVATVGASRVVLGAHYLSDVVGGLLWAGALLACATVALRPVVAGYADPYRI